jgi:hypothetical protein
MTRNARTSEERSTYFPSFTKLQTLPFRKIATETLGKWYNILKEGRFQKRNYYGIKKGGRHEKIDPIADDGIDSLVGECPC